ncbi:MAG: CDP-2,3-bis-(O-geranylgeranyl)-sn-glycerol synthase [Candidatus Parvarchaeota archaeon]|nr:CDP-2,3-bis-(O-geranylgeranyl)-sn-glycerol synthase [Candidatus Jingweiarchaeum tengchongense]MCW1298391.1 CDP-2,3-bis-(O-geranylgeranyl)-sn-glycerol synthase [Candidatus Jingweiarchaeum tengchongense]MCW1300307.1 CDP-2,3-bis-(O-geranylgeranyl)-sn-glycerol synthase [Candidatus Jingweiarchaeum tengchongense]MCW1304897.1 CDP-2,3-bis-(O-geranylgeranyl)-sn-glycerol synthase [Candidatus Jingweiarchaeum tengchongense]MCW1305803.1 CDP-2,3-bis-(O-geranylgeranyl)-sn-glycerol synthase [Candidatus Jing
MNIIPDLIKAFWILIPAYVANATPPLAKGKRPIDFGKFFLGQRIFGDNKTIEGFVTGVICGMITGFIESLLWSPINEYTLSSLGFSLPKMNLFTAFLIAFGAMFGDLVGSFIKRRFGIKPGASVPLLDQLNFVFGTILFIFPFIELNITMVIIMIVITPIFHKIANVFAYTLKIKKVPW